MPVPTFPADQANYVAGLSNDDFANGGHRTHFVLSLLASLAFATYGRDAGAYLEALVDEAEAAALAAAAGSGTETSVTDIRAGAAAQYLSIRRVLAANEPVALTRASTTSWDMAQGINFDLLLDGNVATLANPTNQRAGKSGILRIRQDATGGRAIAAYGSHFRWLDGAPTLPPNPNKVVLVSYLVWQSGEIYLGYGGDA